MRGIGIRIAIVAVIAIGGLLLRDRLTGNVSDLQVGDCFQATAATTVEELQHSPCNEGHTGEVFYVGDFPAADDAPLPATSAFEGFVETNCTAALVAYVGGIEAVQSDPIFQALDLNYFHPIAEGWAQGDREIVCWLGSPTPLTKSLKAAN